MCVVSDLFPLSVFQTLSLSGRSWASWSSLRRAAGSPRGVGGETRFVLSHVLNSPNAKRPLCVVLILFQLYDTWSHSACCHYNLCRVYLAQEDYSLLEMPHHVWPHPSLAWKYYFINSFVYISVYVTLMKWVTIWSFSVRNCWCIWKRSRIKLERIKPLKSHFHESISRIKKSVSYKGCSDPSVQYRPQYRPY